MKPPALEYRLECTDTWRPVPPEVAQEALSAREIAAFGVDATAQQFVRLFAGGAIQGMSASGRAGYFRLAR